MGSKNTKPATVDPDAPTEPEARAAEESAEPVSGAAAEPQPEPLAPHLDDQVARPHVVHLTPRVKHGRHEVRLQIRGVGAYLFRRGERGDLEHVINLTPPQARDLRGRGWTVLEKE